MAKKKKDMSAEELLEQALVPQSEQPYEVPGNWVWTRLGYVAKWGSGGTPSRKQPEYYSGSIPWIKTGELAERYIFDTEEKITDQAINKSSAKLFPINTVVIAMYGATIGRVGIMGVEAATNQACACGVASTAMNCLYLFYYALSQKDSFIQAGKGGAQPNISQEIIKAFSIPLPPLAEQQRIVDRIEKLFEKLDQAKGLIQDALDSFENRKAAILNKAFTGEFTKIWRKNNGLQMDSWETYVLADICVINPKKMDTKRLLDDLTVSFIPMSAVSDVLGVVDKPQEKSLAEVKNGYTNFKENDVIFAKITPCMENGKSAVVGKLINDIGFGSTEFHVLRCTENMNNKYLYHLLRSQHFINEAKAVMTGAVGQQRVPKSFLENYLLKLPSILEQNEIVHILDDLFEKKQNAKELYDLIDNIDLIKKSILARAFRGELGTNNPAEESAKELLK